MACILQMLLLFKICKHLFTAESVIALPVRWHPHAYYWQVEQTHSPRIDQLVPLNKQNSIKFQ